MPDLSELTPAPPLPTHRDMPAANTATPSANVQSVVSPTGRPLVPASWVPYLTAAAGVAFLVAGIPVALVTGGVAVPAWLTATGAVAGAVGGILGVALGASPGLRRTP